MGTTGNFNDIKFEWKVKDFLHLTKELEAEYSSPEFSFADISWKLSIYPNGKTNRTSGYVGLYLKATSLSEPVTMNVSFGIKTVHEKSVFKMTGTNTFHEGILAGWPEIVLVSDLIARKSELLPFGTLTVICTLKNMEADIVPENTCLNCLDAYIQTEQETGMSTLQQHLQEISQNGDFSDIILKVADQEFKAHRCILAARSPVFSAMLKSQMKENVTGIVDIKDVDPKTFTDFLNYLYTGSTEDLASKDITKLYRAADKYQVEVLKKKCLDHMRMNVSVENFCDTFYLSVQHDEEKLKETCIKYFGKHLLEIIKTCKWQSFLCGNPITCNELHIRHLELNEISIDEESGS